MRDIEFSNFMHQLTVVFITEARSSEDLNELFEVYSKYFINMDPLIFGKAIEFLIEIHPRKEFPTVAEINAAIAEIKRDMPREQHYGEECPKCLSMGLYIDKTDNLAKACSCPIGRTRRANLAAHDKKYRYRKANRRPLDYVKGLDEAGEAIEAIRSLREDEK